MGCVGVLGSGIQRWESWGIVCAGVRGSMIGGGGGMEKVSLEGVGWSESEYSSSSSYGFRERGSHSLDKRGEWFGEFMEF